MRDGVSQERRKNVGEMAGEARFSREMAAARGLIGDPAQARRDSPDPGWCLNCLLPAPAHAE